jgi:WD40 repeat protein
MMLLDISKLNKLESKFNEHKEGIEKMDFIKLMKNELPHNPDDEINLVYGLYKLFLEIDFNGDGHMQWEEFTQFIIDTVMGENENKGQDDEDDIVNTGKDTSEKQMIKYKRYNVSNLVEDRSLHDTDIIDAAFSPKIDKLFVVEYKSKRLKIYNPRTGRADHSFDLEYYFKHVSLMNHKKSEKDDKKKKANEVKQALTFSILSICVSHWNIVAICLTNRKIMFFEFGMDGKEEFKYEIMTPTLQKKVWFLQDHNVWLSSGMKGESDKVHWLNEIDIEFEYKNQKLDIHTNIGAKIDEKNFHTNPYRGSIGEHTGEILDMIEIKKPMLILTACMDKLIRLINLNDREIVGKWEDHKSAVRCLDYNPNIGVGLILSVGFEYYINVWSPEVALNDAFKGRLEGHYSPVIMCKFLSGSPMCVSVDEEGNVRVWDSRQLLCLQLIPQEKKNFKVGKLLSLPKYNKFILYGNKIIFYDPKYRDTDIKPKNQKVEDNYPLKVEFNQYYMSFYVSTMKDVRIYSSRNGELQKAFKSLRTNTDADSKIRYFTFEDRFRKFYLGFTNGAVHQFNAGNGSLIKKIGEYEVEKDGISSLKNHHSLEVTSVFYDKANQILLTTAYDSLINIYDESNPEEAIKLRTIKGGHKIQDRNHQIYCMDFSTHLNLFATGSTDGLVTIWDFELSKIDDICYIKNSNKEKVDVYSLKFLDPFPILVSTYSDGSIYFWGVKPNLKYRYECFMRVKNFYMNPMNNKIETCPVYTSLFVNTDMDEIFKSVLIKREVTQTNQIPSSDNKKGMNAMNEEIESGFNYKNLNKLSTKRFSNNKLTKIDPKLSSNNIFQDITKGDLNKDKEEADTNDDVDDEKNDPELDPHRYDNTPNKSYLIIGDMRGYVKILDLRGVIKKFEFERASPAMIKSTYNIMKKDDINVEAILSHYLQKEKKSLDKFTNLYNHIMIREFQAHEDAITCISKIDEPLCFVTCSKDKKFKIWNFNAELWGEVNTQPNFANLEVKNDWKFKIDWEKLKEQEISEVIEIFIKVGGQALKQHDLLLLNEDEEEKDTNLSSQNEKNKKLQTKNENIVKKKRYKPLEEQKKEQKYASYNDDADIKYDDHYVQEIKKKIDLLIQPHVQEVGMYEMSKNLFDSVLKKEYNDNMKNLFNTNVGDKEAKKSNLMLSSNQKTKKLKTSPTKQAVNNSRDGLFSEKFFKGVGNNKKSDELLLPMINSSDSK